MSICRRAIQMNILYNPTGKKGAFRAIDWLVEHNNLYIKASRSRQRQMAFADKLLADLWWEVFQPSEGTHPFRIAAH